MEESDISAIAKQVSILLLSAVIKESTLLASRNLMIRHIAGQKFNMNLNLCYLAHTQTLGVQPLLKCVTAQANSISMNASSGTFLCIQLIILRADSWSVGDVPRKSTLYSPVRSSSDLLHQVVDRRFSSSHYSVQSNSKPTGDGFIPHRHISIFHNLRPESKPSSGTSSSLHLVPHALVHQECFTE